MSHHLFLNYHAKVQIITKDDSKIMIYFVTLRKENNYKNENNTKNCTDSMEHFVRAIDSCTIARQRLSHHSRSLHTGKDCASYFLGTTHGGKPHGDHPPRIQQM